MEELPIGIRDTISSFEGRIGELEAVLKPFFENEKALLSRLSPMDTAKLNLTISYAIATLFYLYLKTQGVSPADHPVKKELERIRQHIQKLKNLTDGEGIEPETKLDLEAAERMISAGTGISGKKRKNPESPNEDESPTKKHKSTPSGSKKSKR